MKRNDTDLGIWEFPPTGGVNLECARNLTLPIHLEPGENRVTLTMEEGILPGLCVDAFSILPADD